MVTSCVARRWCGTWRCLRKTSEGLAWPSRTQLLSSILSVQLVRRIEVPAKDIKWSGGGDLVAIVGEASFYVLRCDRDAMAAALESGEQLDEDGIEDAFELQTETSEAVRTGERDHHGLLSRSAQCVITDISQQEPEAYETMRSLRSHTTLSERWCSALAIYAWEHCRKGAQWYCTCFAVRGQSLSGSPAVCWLAAEQIEWVLAVR